MTTNTQQGFEWDCSHDGVDVNRKVWYRDVHEKRAVFVLNTPFYVFERNDEVQARFCAVQLVEAELATVQQVCNAFEISHRTFSRIRQLVRQGGIAALVKEQKPQGRRKKTKENLPAIVRLYLDGQSTYEIARLLGISPRTVGRVLKDQGVSRRGNNGKPLFDNPQQQSDDTDQTIVDADKYETPLPVIDVPKDNDAKRNIAKNATPQTFATVQADHQQADHEQTDRELIQVVSGSSNGSTSPATSTTITASVAAGEDHSPPTNPNRHTLAASVEATSIPYASSLDRMCLRMGLIDEAPVAFESAAGVAGAGTLMGLALLGENGLLEEARGVYGGLRKCWYGLRPMIWTLLVMAWLRIKKPEQIKGCDPASLGSLLGLPRAAEVKTIRRKLQEIADQSKAAELHRRMAQRRAEEHDSELFRLYIDGHVRVYYGKRRIAKTHVTRLNSWQRGETDYWVHLSGGHPLLVVRDAAHESFTSVMREQVLPEIRRVIGPRRVRVVFDRVGWCQELFRVLLAEGFDFMTYRCQPYEPLDESLLQTVTWQVGQEQVVYELAEGKFEEEGWPPLRLIAVKRKDGGQTHIVVSGRATWEWMEQEVEEEDPSAEELAWGMFGRWTQENWFKYMMSEYDLDVLLEYTTEPDDPEREVPNPAWRKLDKEVAAARKSLRQSQATYAQRRLKQKQEECKSSGEGEGKACQLCGKCLACKLKAGEGEIEILEGKYRALLDERRETPQRIRLGDVLERDAVKLSYERKLFSDTIKLSAYEIETRLYGLLRGTFVRREEEGRSLLRSIFSARGDLRVCDEVLEVHLEQLSSPRYTEAMLSLCEALNALNPTLDETNLRLSFHVKPRPVGE